MYFFILFHLEIFTFFMSLNPVAHVLQDEWHTLISTTKFLNPNTLTKNNR